MAAPFATEATVVDAAIAVPRAPHYARRPAPDHISDATAQPYAVQPPYHSETPTAPRGHDALASQHSQSSSQYQGQYHGQYQGAPGQRRDPTGGWPASRGSSGGGEAGTFRGASSYAASTHNLGKSSVRCDAPILASPRCPLVTLLPVSMIAGGLWPGGDQQALERERCGVKLAIAIGS